MHESLESSLLAQILLLIFSDCTVFLPTFEARLPGRNRVGLALSTEAIMRFRFALDPTHSFFE